MPVCSTTFVSDSKPKVALDDVLALIDDTQDGAVRERGHSCPIAPFVIALAWGFIGWALWGLKVGF